MKWKNFERLLKRNPDVDTFIRLHIGPPILSATHPHSAVEEQRIKWFEEKVKFVAFRNFNSLNLNRKSETETESAVPDTLAKTKLVMRWTEVRFFIHFHIVGADKPCERMIHVDNMEVGDSKTIAETIQGRIEWHKEYWAKQGKDLKFDYVVQRTKVWENDKKPPLTYTPWNPTFVSESLELYRFPSNFDLATTCEGKAMVEKSRHAQDLLDELRGYGDQKQKEAMVEALSWQDIELLQGQNLTSDERQLILDIVDPLPTHDLV